MVFGATQQYYSVKPSISDNPFEDETEAEFQCAGAEGTLINFITVDDNVPMHKPQGVAETVTN